MKKSSLVGAVFFLSISILSAQNIINGKVTDIEGHSVPFVSIKVYSTENNKDVVSEKVTDENGEFNINVLKEGNYNVTTSASGYSDISKNYMLDSSHNTLTILLSKEKIAGIKEIILVATKKKIFERKVDRFIFNTENSIVSKGADGLDVLAATPLVKADNEGNIEIVGKNSVSIMINDKPVNLSGKELISYLKSIRSENIERIEVITIPPAKYEAQGNSGIINIILKQNSNMGFSGNISTNYQRNSQNSYSNNGSLNYQSKRLNTSLRISQFNNEKRTNENLSIYAGTILKTENRRLDKSKGYNINYSIDYKISDKTSIGAIYNFSDTDTDSNSKNFSRYYKGGNLDSTVVSNTYNISRLNNNQLNIYFETKLDSLGKKIYVGGNLFDSQNNNPFSLASESDVNNINYKINSKYRYKIYSGQLDLYFPFTTFIGEIGGKYTHFNTDTGLDFFINDGGIPVYDNNRSNFFDYSSVLFCLDPEQIIPDPDVGKFRIQPDPDSPH